MGTGDQKGMSDPFHIRLSISISVCLCLHSLICLLLSMLFPMFVTIVLCIYLLIWGFFLFVRFLERQRGRR